MFTQSASAEGIFTSKTLARSHVPVGNFRKILTSLIQEVILRNSFIKGIPSSENTQIT
jgi:hypothetical protein